MAVDAVTSMVGVGLGDAVVEAVLSGGAATVASIRRCHRRDPGSIPGGEAILAGGHAIEAHA